MNAHERDLLQHFLRQVQESRPAQKDPLAASMIQSMVAANPDAVYVLVQRALGAELALKQYAGASNKAGSDSMLSVGGVRSVLGTTAAVAAGTAVGAAVGFTAGGFILDGLRAVLDDSGLSGGLAEGLEPLGDLTDWI